MSDVAADRLENTFRPKSLATVKHLTETIDFGRSYLRFRIDRAAQAPITVTHSMPTMVNNVRIQIECRCELTNRRTGQAAMYALGAACKTERVGGKGDLWLAPNADFSLVASREEFLILKSWARNQMALAQDPEADGIPQERQSGKACEAWADFSYDLCRASGSPLESIDEIVAAMRGNRPIIARTEYDDGDWSVSIEHPVKAINYSEVDQVYQTDTGPVLLPDLSPERLARGPRLIDCFDLAYSAFNSAGWAEFIVNVPTQVADGVSVNHYSMTRHIEPAKNTLAEVLERVRSPLVQTADDRMLRTDSAAEFARSSNGSIVERLQSER